MIPGGPPPEGDGHARHQRAAEAPQPAETHGGDAARGRSCRYSYHC